MKRENEGVIRIGLFRPSFEIGVRSPHAASSLNTWPAQIKIWWQTLCHQWSSRWLEITFQSSVTLSQINLISGLFTAGILSLLRLLSGSRRPCRRTWRFCNWILETMVNENKGRWVVCGFKLIVENSQRLVIRTFWTLDFCSLISLISLSSTK